VVADDARRQLRPLRAIRWEGSGAVTEALDAGHDLVSNLGGTA
jgi:hypothetical protein